MILIRLRVNEVRKAISLKKFNYLMWSWLLGAEIKAVAHLLNPNIQAPSGTFEQIAGTGNPLGSLEQFLGNGSPSGGTFDQFLGTGSASGGTFDQFLGTSGTLEQFGTNEQSGSFRR